MLKDTETKGTIGVFVTFLSLVIFQSERGQNPALPPPGYAYVHSVVFRIEQNIEILKTV